MNTDTGRIYTAKDMDVIRKALDVACRRDLGQGVVEAVEALKAGKLKPMQIKPTLMQRLTRRIGRNAPCPCGSGKKFKKCCYTGPR